jgi:hypothetical protein
MQHVRQYLTEMPRRGVALGFEELNPNETAHRLFTPSTDLKVALVSPPWGNVTAMHTEALMNRNITVRSLPPQGGLQDFCALQSAQHTMIGSGLSSYFAWAALLGNCSRIRAYSLDSVARREWAKRVGESVFQWYDWTFDTDLRERFQFELYTLS